MGVRWTESEIGVIQQPYNHGIVRYSFGVTPLFRICFSHVLHNFQQSFVGVFPDIKFNSV